MFPRDHGRAQTQARKIMTDQSSLDNNSSMARFKNFVLDNFERLLIVIILGVVAASHFWFVRGTPVLFFYYLPALIAGYVLGKRSALMTAILCVCAVALAAIISPASFIPSESDNPKLTVFMDLLAWGGFLILAALVTGQLYEDKERRIQELKSAYIGILEVLARYLESPEGPAKGHCLRVANLSAEIAVAMGLPRATVDNVHAAALLHDMHLSGDGISGDVIHKAAMLSENQDALKSQDSKTAEILTSVGTVLKEAVVLIRCHSDQANPSAEPVALDALPLGARIVSVADAYDDLTISKPYATGRAPWVAVKEIEKGAGTRYDAQVVEGLKSVVAHRLDEDKLVMNLTHA